MGMWNTKKHILLHALSRFFFVEIGSFVYFAQFLQKKQVVVNCCRTVARLFYVYILKSLIPYDPHAALGGVRDFGGTVQVTPSERKRKKLEHSSDSLRRMSFLRISVQMSLRVQDLKAQALNLSHS